MQRSRNVTQKCSGKTETLYLENVFQQLDTSMYRTDANQTKRGKGYSMVSGGKWNLLFCYIELDINASIYKIYVLDILPDLLQFHFWHSFLWEELYGGGGPM